MKTDYALVIIDTEWEGIKDCLKEHYYTDCVIEALKTILFSDELMEIRNRKTGGF